MKSKSILLTLALSFCLTALVNASSPYIKPSNTLVTKFQQVLADSGIDFQKHDNEKIQIRFMVNSSNEIIVISTDNDELDYQLKNSLNYCQVENADLIPMRVYLAPVTLKAGN